MPSASSITTRRGRPMVGVFIDIPDWPEDLLKREHNKYAKQALREALEYHHRVHIPRHFQKSARQRYGYKPRKESYIREKLKRFKTGTDLVKTGRLKAVMTSGQKTIDTDGRTTPTFRTRMGGAAVGGKKDLEGKLIYRLPFGGGTGATKAGSRKRNIEIRDIISELQRLTDDEVRSLQDVFSTRYWALVTERRKKRRRNRRTA